MRRAAIALALALAGSTTVAHAQSGDVDLDRGPVAELYIRKRPPAPESPALSPELQKLLMDAEQQRDAKREEAISLLRGFLAGKPEGETRAEGLFKLADLLWEDARRIYLEKVDAFQHEEERCRQKHCKKVPSEPKIDLAESEETYKQLLTDYPDFRRRDLVLYLVGFADKEAGREDEALAMFQEVIAKHPDSPLYGDSWMMIGEHWFAAEKWEEARKAYAEILTHPDAPTYDMALFKAAWCDWKMADVDKAKDELGQLLKQTDTTAGATAAQVRAKSDLREQALDYLVIIFTEDQSITAGQVYDFLASVGDDKYAHDVLIKVAEAYFGQTEYERSSDTYRYLIQQDPEALSAASYQRKIVENWVAALDEPTARKEMKVLVDSYGPASPWARHQRGEEDALGKSLSATEALVRTTATNMHAEAQQAEDRTKKPDVGLYQAAADAYGIYLGGFDQEPGAQEIRYHLGDILYFKLGKYEEAGDAYLAVGKSAPVGQWHKPALKQAMDAFEKARPHDTAGKKQMYPVDKKFGEAMDLYATLFKDDKDVVPLLFKYGQLFYDYGDYDEAIKRFGVIVTQYPDDPNALPAGERILKALKVAKDYENIESWARKLKKVKAFQSKDELAELDKVIVDAIHKSGDQYADAGKYEQAATFYLRIPKEFPKESDAPKAMMNAGVMYEKAKKPEQAAGIYLDLADQYPKSSQGAAAAFDAGQLYEKVAYFDRAADAYETMIDKFPDARDADSALYNAAILRQSLGQYDKAIAHFTLYARKFKDHKDAPEVAFRIGQVYEDQGDDGRADATFRDFAKTYKTSRRVIEAHVRAGRASFRLGQYKRAAEELDTAQKLYKKASGGDKAAGRAWAAEARYWQGELIYKDFEKISLDVKPSALEKTLKKKTDLLIKAQGVYASVIDFQDFHWATAALYRIGNVFEGYGDSMRDAPTPKGLSDQDAEAYRNALDMEVVDIQDKAIQAYTAGYQKAIQLQVYDEYTSKIREALGRLSSDDFPPEAESRASVRTGDRPLDVKVIKEVDR